VNIVHVLELELEATVLTFRVGLETFKLEKLILGIGDEFLDCEFGIWGSTHAAPSAAARGVVSVRRKDGS
jgi:hypothetical protein